MGARNPRSEDTATPRSHAATHHQGEVASNQRRAPPATMDAARPSAAALPKSFHQLPSVCEDIPAAFSNRYPPRKAKGSSIATKSAYRRTRNRTEEAQECQWNERTESRSRNDPPRMRARTATPETRVRPAESRSRSEEHTSELQSQSNLVCRLLLEKKKP